MEALIYGPGYHAVPVDGRYVIHAWGGAGGNGDADGGYVCWKGELNETVELFIGTRGAESGGGASTIVKADSATWSQPHPDNDEFDVKPDFDMTGYLAIAGGGGGSSETPTHVGGIGGTQIQAVDPGVGGVWRGATGSASAGGYAGTGGMFTGGAKANTGGAFAEDGELGIGGSGGGPNGGANSHPGVPFSSSGQGGSGKSSGGGGGGGGGGFGGGGAGGAGRPFLSSTQHAGGGGGGGSYVAPSSSPCTQADIDNAPLPSSPDGGVVILPPTVIDFTTGLEWTASTYTGDWYTAVAHGEALEPGGWRLPTAAELQALYPLDTNRYDGWPGAQTNDSFYWTSEEIPHDPTFARVVDFATGGAPSYLKPKNFVSYRLVRDTGLPTTFDTAVDRYRSSIGSSTWLNWTEGSVTVGDDQRLSLATPRLAGWGLRGGVQEHYEITELELEIDDRGLISTNSVTGNLRVEDWAEPTNPPVSIDPIHAVTGRFDRNAVALHLSVLDEHGTTRAYLVLPVNA